MSAKRWLALGGILLVTLVLVVFVRSRTSTSAREASQATTTERARSRRQPSRPSDDEPTGTLRLAGRVVGPDGRVAVGAEVWIESDPERTVTSGVDGAFELDRLSDRSYTLRAKHGDLVGGPQLAKPTAGGTPIVIELREGAHLLVTVVEAASAPIANAEVRVVGEELVVITDEKGLAKVTAHPGWIEIEALAGAYAPRRVSIPVGTFGSKARITIVLHNGFLVRGRVLDESRKPIANARVYAQQMSAVITSGDEKETAITDETGTFTIPSAVGMHSLVVIDDEHAPETSPTFDIDRAITDLEIIMRRGGVYAGSVVDADGKAVAGARVHCDAMGPLGTRHYSATTDAKGTFEIRGLPRTSLSAYAISDKGISDETTVLLREPEQRDQKLVLKPIGDANGVIAGMVVDDRGAPVPEVMVNAALGGGTMAMLSEGVDGLGATSTRTDARGQFSLTGLLAGDYELWPGAFAQRPFPLVAAQHLPSLDRSWFVTVAKTGEKSVRLVMPRAGAVTGKVVFADTGEPVQELTVAPEPTHGDELGTSGEHGGFELRGLRPGALKLRIKSRGFVELTKEVRVEPGKTTDVGTLTVQRGRTLRGKVVDGAGRPVAGAKVMVGVGGVYGGLGKFDDPLGDHLVATVTDAHGAFAIAGFQLKPRGVMSVLIGADHPSYGRALPIEIPARAQDLAAVTLVLRECGSIAGRVTQNGQPVAGATIGAGTPEMGMANTTEDGSFVISRLPAGPVVLHIHTPTELSRTHQRTVQVEAGKQTAAPIEIATGTIQLAVTVMPKPGDDVAGAQLFLLSGTIAVENYAQLTARLFAAKQGIRSWDGDPSQPVLFDRLLAGDHTLCAMPLAWKPDDKRMTRIQRGDREAVKVYCTPVRVAPSPAQQTLTVDVPAMAPLP